MVDHGAVVATALLPGMPHLLAVDAAGSWRDLRVGVETVGERFRQAGVDTVLTMSTQWFTVLGHQFQLDPNPRGARTDENWYAYDYGHIKYDLRIDTELTEKWVELTAAQHLQSRRTHYEGFPIDTGTVVAATLLDPGRQFRMALVSCNLYAEVDALSTIGRAGVAAAERVGRRIGVVAVTGLSAGLLQRWIEPSEDHIAASTHDTWNRRMIDALVSGRIDQALALREDFAREASADSQFRALAFLAGAGGATGPAELLAYGPVWGTGAAVLYWQ
ncbi:DODA-type extradiol aromatic ring-opening family dioxygenase [Pseudonocardia sp. T1-2H]|uniref:DODA-type extradiol aromatic ring-opening family dioxygenase n=1 Tax=Pseudonocardia sp. T1-2H TaxID=3128899 RepID=UPI0031011FA8